MEERIDPIRDIRFEDKNSFLLRLPLVLMIRWVTSNVRSNSQRSKPTMQIKVAINAVPSGDPRALRNFSLWLLTRKCRGLTVSLTYCMPHTTHRITYIRWEEHVILVAMGKRSRVAAEMMQFLSSKMGQVRHPVRPHQEATLATLYRRVWAESNITSQRRPGDKSLIVGHIL